MDRNKKKKTKQTRHKNIIRKKYVQLVLYVNDYIKYSIICVTGNLTSNFYYKKIVNK